MHCNFQMSCPLFGGFECVLWIDPTQDVALSHVVQRVLDELQHCLQQAKLVMLLEQLRSRRHRYHIHSASLEQLHSDPSLRTVYVCQCEQ